MQPAQTGTRWRRNLWIAGGLLAAYALFGFLGAPPIVKAQLEKRASAALGRTVTVGKVRVNPFAISLTLENLDVRLKAGQGSFLGWNRLYVNADPLASLFGVWTLGAVELDGFHVTAILHPDGRFNFADILARLSPAAPTPAAPAGPPVPLPAVRIGRLAVTQARLDFSDESRARLFATMLGPVSFNVTEFQTAGARGAPYRFEAVTEAGEKLTWSGTLTAVPLASAGELRLENIHLPKYAAYYADLVQAEITDGKLSAGGRYEASIDSGKRVLQLAGGGLQVRDLKVVTRTEQQPLLDLPVLDVAGVDADALALKARIATVALTGGRINAARGRDGTVNLLTALRPAPAATGPVAAPPAATPASPGLDFLIGQVTVKDLAVDMTDHTVPGVARLGLTGLQVSVKNVTLADGAEMPLDLGFNWAPAGAVKVAGTVALRPELRANLQTDIVGLALLPLSPYLEQFANVHLTRGAVATSGAVTVAPGAGLPAVTFAGRVALEQLGLVDAVHNEPLAGFAALALNGLQASTAPQLTVTLDEVNVAGPYARILVNEDGTINLAALAKAENPDANNGQASGRALPDASTGTPKAGDAAPPADTSRPVVTIGKVVVADGEFSFADRSLQPGVRMAITEFGGTIAGLSSESLAKADVDLRATVDGAGPVGIKGQLDPLGARKFVNLKVDFRNVDLLPLSPYSGKYAGYELARGQLNLDVQAKLDDRRLEATNVITLNQFTFGAPVESPDATKLPVRLGVALLKDLDGRIVIDVPIAGSLDDPELRIGKVVLRVVVNLLTKAAVSPFALLGSMFGGGGDELAFQEFAPGGSDLLPAEAGKLATMVKALVNRPGLSLGLEGGFDGPADTHALREQRLAALVRSRLWEERRAADPNLAPPEQLEITPEEHAAMVKRIFDEKFPPGTEFGAPLPPPPVVAAAPAPPKRNLFRRVVEVFTGEGAPVAASPAGIAPAAPDAAAGPSLAEMSGRLAATLAVTDDDLRALADARARRVRDYFLVEGKIAADRLFLTQAKDPKENKGPRVFLSLQ